MNPFEKIGSSSRNGKNQGAEDPRIRVNCTSIYKMNKTVIDRLKRTPEFLNHRPLDPLITVNLEMIAA
jgi:hypothetical protein